MKDFRPDPNAGKCPEAQATRVYNTFGKEKAINICDRIIEASAPNRKGYHQRVKEFLLKMP